jgi:hypothetical protein
MVLTKPLFIDNGRKLNSADVKHAGERFSENKRDETF